MPNPKRSESVRQLLDLAMTAHGGLDRWQRVRKIDLSLTVGGALFIMKGKGKAVGKPFSAEIHTRERKTILTPFANQEGLTGGYTPDGVWMERDGEIFAEAGDQAALRGFFRSLVPWNDLGLLYFSGYAIQLYFTMPFPLADESFGLEEISPRKIHGERCRGLRITYPDHFISHSKQEKLYFNPEGRIVRHDYRAAAASAMAFGAHYSMDYFTADGFLFPARRRAYFNFLGFPTMVVIRMDIDSARVHLDE